ncbi:DnaB-like helicase C-terminal domain-containing protein [Dyadobacter sp. CY323]|uniref:replicative DNA helicase n=1 Tax=Dyadobacter sp. CY323 TaxID=2907302 RepID=UPI001F21DBD3|nr:DnaB-like helicase C-terminal domain-containing protein [Dyadobacter sp. CY323]MCE6992083.1 hypothetical protein [Dyadobacter sp. CY323]
MNSIFLPPYSKDLERDVLAVLSHRPELLVKVEEILNSDCFFNPEYKYLFDVIFGIHLSGKDVTQSAILQTIVPSGKGGILKTYQEIRKFFTSESSLWQNSLSLSELSVKRAILEKSMEIQTMIAANESVDKLDQLVNQTAEIVTTRNRPVNGNNFSESLDEMERAMNRPITKGLSGIETGIPDINELTGGWEEDDIVVIAGRPGMGKTLSGIFHAYHAALSGIPVGFVSLEMRKYKLTSRIMSGLTGFPSSDIDKGRLAQNQKEIVQARRKRLENLPIYYYENTNSWDINDICLTLRNWKRKYGIGLLFFDYIQLIRDRTIRDSSDKTKVVTSVQEKLTHLKSSLRVPLVELAQLSRNNESRGGDKRPQLSDLKNSGQIEQDASIVIFLYRQDYYDALAAKEKGEEFIYTNDLEYIIAKNRAGETGPVELKADMRTNRIWSPHQQFPAEASSFKLPF